MKKELTYEDVSLFSRQVSTVTSRFSADMDMSQEVAFGNTTLKLGMIMSSPMLDVTGMTMCAEMAVQNQLGILHRFMTVEEQTSLLKSTAAYTMAANNITGFSVGINDSVEKLNAFVGMIKDYGFGDTNFLICVDTANGSSVLLKDTIEYIKKISKDVEAFNINIEILAGNVVTYEAAEYLYNQGVKFIRVGISGGSACSTSEVTGIFRPLVSCIQEIAENRNANKQDFYIVADGGIKTPADMLKALAVGADFVMLGGLLAGYDCSNSPLVKQSFWQKLFGKPKRKYYRGMASAEMARLNNKVNNLNKTILAEGVERTVLYRGELRPVLQNIINSFRSSFSYCNARNVAEFRKNVEVVEITHNSATLRKPHFGN